MQRLLTLLQSAGHQDFREARGPMGFTQRQAGGRFTREEAEAFIGRLEDAESEPGMPLEPPMGQPSAQEQLVGRLPADLLASELRRRGWLVIDPLNP